MSTWVDPRFLIGSMLLILLVFYVGFLFSCFVSLRHVSCVSNVASVSGLYILDCPSVFSNVYLYMIQQYYSCLSFCSFSFAHCVVLLRITAYNDVFGILKPFLLSKVVLLLFKKGDNICCWQSMSCLYSFDHCIVCSCSIYGY